MTRPTSTGNVDTNGRRTERWNAVLAEPEFRRLLKTGRAEEIAAHAVRIESRTNLLFSFEKMALRDATKSWRAPRHLRKVYSSCSIGTGLAEEGFTRWIEVVATLPRRQTRVLTWPMVTVFGFIADPTIHVFLKPKVTKRAAQAYDFDLITCRVRTGTRMKVCVRLPIKSGGTCETFAPASMMDIQSFIWVLGFGRVRRVNTAGNRDPGSGIRGPRSAMYRPSAIGIVEKREIQEKESPAP